MSNIIKVEDIQAWIAQADGMLCCAQDYIRDWELFEPRGEADNVVFKLFWYGVDTEKLTVEENEVSFTERDLANARVTNGRILYISTKEKHIYFFELFKHTALYQHQ